MYSFIEASILGFMEINTWGVKIQFDNVHDIETITPKFET